MLTIKMNDKESVSIMLDIQERKLLTQTSQGNKAL